MKKKVVIGVVVIIVILLCFVIFLSTKKSNDFYLPPGGLKQHRTAQFSLSYPDMWMVEERSIVNGGAAFVARVRSATTFFPRFEVQATPIGGQTKESKIKVLQFYKLERSEIEFKERNATKLAGDLQLHFDTGNPEQKQVYKVFLFIETDTQLYTISYAYFRDKDQAQSEEIMQKMLDSLELY